MRKFVLAVIAIFLSGCAISERLVSKNDVTRAVAEQVLATSSGEKKITVAAQVSDKLVHALATNDQEVIKRASNALAKIGPLAVTGFSRYWELEASGISVDYDKVAESVATVFAGIGPEAIPPLVQILNEGRKTTRSYDRTRENAALKALADIGSPSAVSVLIQLLRSGDLWTREGAQKALVKIGGSAVPSLIEVLGDKVAQNEEEVQVRVGVAAVLGKIGPAAQEAIPALVRSLGDDNVRDAATLSISQMGPRGISLLTRALKIKRPEIQLSAAKALWSLQSTVSPAGVADVDEERAVVAEALKAVAEYREAESRIRNEAAAKQEAKETAKRLRSRDADSGILLNSIGNCMGAEGKMVLTEQVAQTHAERSQSAPSQKMIADMLDARREGAAKCQQFTIVFSNYSSNYGDEGYAYLWDHCDKKYNVPLCASLRYWLQTHR